MSSIESQDLPLVGELPPPGEVRRRLDAHLDIWLGAWPPSKALQVVAAPQRTEPGWDGAIHRIVGVASPGGAVLSVPPEVAPAVRALGSTLDAVASGIGGALGKPGGTMFQGAFRWCEQPAQLPDAGIWLPAEDPRIPAWLVPFGGEVLVALDDDQHYMAGVGIKRHDRYGQELAVGTEPAYQGRGLARKLVAQAARRILQRGAVPTYLHAFSNIASAHAADAAGFPDRGWKILGFHAE